jgi:DNA-binding MarR family transcriptional regulator
MTRTVRSIKSPAPSVPRPWQDHVPNDRMAHLVKLAARGLARALQMRLAAHSVSYGHWTFLRILWANEGLTQRQLSAQAGVMEPTTVSALRAMEKRGTITRRQNPHSRRETHVFLTAEGRALKNKLVPLAEDVNAVGLRGVAAADIAATRRTLLALIQNLLADERETGTARRMPSTRAWSLVQAGKASARPARSRRA